MSLSGAYYLITFVKSDEQSNSYPNNNNNFDLTTITLRNEEFRLYENIMILNKFIVNFKTKYIFLNNICYYGFEPSRIFEKTRFPLSIKIDNQIF